MSRPPATNGARIEKDRVANMRNSGGGNPTTPAPTKCASSVPLAASCDICTTRRRALHPNAVTAAPSSRVYVETSLSGGRREWNTDDGGFIGPCPPSSRVRHDQPAEEDCSARIRRFALRQLRQGPCHPRFLDRRAEDCQESDEGGGEEEQVDGR